MKISNDLEDEVRWDRVRWLARVALASWRRKPTVDEVNSLAVRIYEFVREKEKPVAKKAKKTKAKKAAPKKRAAKKKSSKKTAR